MKVTVSDMRLGYNSRFGAEATVMEKPGLFEAAVLRKQTRIYKVFGSGTVWRRADDGERLGTWMEGVLADAYALYKYRGGV